MALTNWTYAPNKPSNTLGAREYQEYKETGRATLAANSSVATRTFIVNWDVQEDFLDDLIGYASLNANNTIHRIVPDVHPNFPTFYATNATVEGKGVLGKANNIEATWDCAFVTAEYRPLDYAVLSDAAWIQKFPTSLEMDRYVTRKYGFQADYMTLYGGLKYCTAPQNVLTSPPGKITCSMPLQYVWHKVPAKATNPFVLPCINAINSCLGQVNSAAFDPNGGNYPAGTVLFTGAEATMEMPLLAQDTWYWEVTFSFIYRNNGAGLGGETAGHQYIYRLDTTPAIWDLVTGGAGAGTVGGQRIYTTTDLNNLFVIS